MTKQTQTAFLLVTLMTAGLSPLAYAQTAPAATENSATTPAQAQQTPAGKFIQDVGDRAVAVMANKSLSTDQRDTQYRAILSNAFDLPTIGHFVLGNAWEAAGPNQRDEYMSLFKTLVVKTYGDKLNLYNGEKFVVKAVRPETDRDSVVNSEIIHADGSAPLQVDWRVRNRDGNQTIIDVVVAGVSQAITQRSEYASILQRNNGNIEALLSDMRQQANGSTNAAQR